MILLVCVSLLLFYQGILCNQVTQSPLHQTVTSGSKVTLFCTYYTTYSNPDLYWYRIRPDRSFQFILYRDNTRSKDADFTRGRFTVQHSQSQRSFHLVISSVEPEDSATYYCGIYGAIGGIQRVIGYDAQLFFGAGTRLIVEPTLDLKTLHKVQEPTSNVEPQSPTSGQQKSDGALLEILSTEIQDPAIPSVFIMRNGTTVACLVKDFYPKDIDIKLESTTKLEEFDPAIVVSPSGKYSAVKLGRYEDPNTVTCLVEHNSKVVSSTDFEPKTDSSGTVKPKPMEPENIELTPKSNSELKGRHSSQFTAGNVNMLSLTVLGLRMVFAKSLAINFLLTAKLFFF